MAFLGAVLLLLALVLPRPLVTKPSSSTVRSRSKKGSFGDGDGWMSGVLSVLLSAALVPAVAAAWLALAGT